MEKMLNYEAFRTEYLESKTPQEKQELVDLQYQRIQTLSAEESMAEIKMLSERLNQIKAQLSKETLANA
jgi:hypothetical protein